MSKHIQKNIAKSLEPESSGALALRAAGNERITLQALIDVVPAYLWVKDLESRFVVVNKALASDSGFSRTSDMVGLSDFALHEPAVATEFRALEQEIIRSGQPMIDREESVIDASGVQRWLLSTKAPLRTTETKSSVWSALPTTLPKESA